MKKLISTFLMFMFLFIGNLFSGNSFAEDSRDKLIKVRALEIIEVSKYCTLISIGEDGYPNARIMDPFPPDKDWVIWMGTNSQSRKVEDILNNNKISVFYESPGGDGYVTLKGTGTINNEDKNKVKFFKKGWEEFYPGKREDFTLIKFKTESIEIVSYKKGLLGDKISWAAPSIKLKRN